KITFEVIESSNMIQSIMGLSETSSEISSETSSETTSDYEKGVTKEDMTVYKSAHVMDKTTNNDPYSRQYNPGSIIVVSLTIPKGTRYYNFDRNDCDSKW